MDFYNFIKEYAENEGIERFVVGAIITNEKGEILITKRKVDDFMGGLYEIPGGNLEDNESILDTLIRETKEETNLELVEVVSYVNSFDYLSRSCKKCRQFNFKIIVKSLNNIILTEHDEYKWIKLNEVENIIEMSPEVKQSLLIYVFNEIQNSKR